MRVLYSIKSKNVSMLNDLKQLLERRKFSPSFQSDTLLEVEIPDIEKDDFALLLAFVIGYYSFRKMLNEELKKNSLQDDVRDRYFYSACQYFQNSKYWIGLTKVWVSDFLENKTMINADTFATFNMKGFKQEVKSYVENVIAHEEAHQDVTRSVQGLEPIGMEELFSLMKERVNESRLILSNFKELHIRERGNGFLVQDQEGNVLNEEFFIANVGMMVHLGLPEDEEPETIQDAMNLMCLTHIFEPDSIIIHRGLSEEAEDVINENESQITKHTSKSVSFIDCEGCKLCDNE